MSFNSVSLLSGDPNNNYNNINVEIIIQYCYVQGNIPNHFSLLYGDLNYNCNGQQYFVNIKLRLYWHWAKVKAKATLLKNYTNVRSFTIHTKHKWISLWNIEIAFPFLSQSLDVNVTLKAPFTPSDSEMFLFFLWFFFVFAQCEFIAGPAMSVGFFGFGIFIEQSGTRRQW